MASNSAVIIMARTATVKTKLPQSSPIDNGIPDLPTFFKSFISSNSPALVKIVIRANRLRSDKILNIF